MTYSTDGRVVSDKEGFCMGIFSTVSVLNEKIEKIKELEEKLALTESWVKHHQNSVTIAMKDRRELEEKLAVARDALEVIAEKPTPKYVVSAKQEAEFYILNANQALEKIKR